MHAYINIYEYCVYYTFEKYDDYFSEKKCARAARGLLIFSMVYIYIKFLYIYTTRIYIEINLSSSKNKK